MHPPVGAMDTARRPDYSPRSMIAALRHHASLRQLAAWLLLATVLLRGLIPAGMMPDFAALSKGEIRIVICTGMGPQAMPTPMPALAAAPAPAAKPAGSHVPQTPGAHDHGVCPFAAALAFFAPILLALLAFFCRVTLTVGFARPQRCRAIGLSHAWSARAPPVFA